MEKNLLVCETFSSIQGETTFAGRPCFFIRLAGCNLRCRYCDTKYAWRGGRECSIAQLEKAFKKSRLSLALVTGGEPLLQEHVCGLLATLARQGTTMLETNGTRDISRVPGKVITILDIKCPGSGFAGQNDWHNLERLRPHDEVKFVVCDRNDYQWSRRIIHKYGLIGKCRAVNISPAAGSLSPAVLADWILKDRLAVRLNLQLHKIIWPKAVRGK
jgi:7-carboxy-7-deazaguanine synthase